MHYDCDECDYKAKQKGALKRHKGRKHKEIKTNFQIKLSNEILIKNSGKVLTT